MCLQVRAGSFRKKTRKKITARPKSEASRARASGRSRARTRLRFLTESTETNLKASTTAHHHVHAHPAVGITSTEPGRKASPCASLAGGLGPAKSLRLRPDSDYHNRKSRHAYEPLTHGLRSLRFRYASYRKFGMLKVLRAVQDSRASTEIWPMPVSRV